MTTAATSRERIIIQGRKFLGTVEGLSMFVEIEYTEKPAEYTTTGKPVTWGRTDHGPRIAARRELSICADLTSAIESHGGGQSLDSLRALIDGPAENRAIPLDDARALLAIWEAWHLNGMRPGCDHQTEGNYSDPKISGQVCQLFPNIDSDTGGYKYGSAWLFKAVPAEVENWLRELLARPSKPAPLPFVTRAGITATATEADDNPAMKDDGRDPGRRHWRVKFTRRELGVIVARMVVPFTQGSAHTKPPTAADVLACLVSDASSAGQTFEAWAGDLGYDTDSRESLRTFRAVEKQTAKLRKFLGDKFYTEAMEA